MSIQKIREELSSLLGRRISSVFKIGTLIETGETLYGINNSNGILKQVAVYSNEQFVGIL